MTARLIALQSFILWGIFMVYLGIILVCIVFFAIIIALSKNKKPFKRAFLSMMFGIVILLALNLFGHYINVTLPLSPFSLTVSACGGVPGVAAMVLINAVF